MNFGMIMLNQSTKTKQNYATWILIALLLIFVLKTLTVILKDGLIHLTMIRMTRPLPMGMKKKVIGLFKDELRKSYEIILCA